MDASNHAHSKELLQIWPNDLFLTGRNLNDKYGVPEPACVSKYTAPHMFDVLLLEVSSNCQTG